MFRVPNERRIINGPLGSNDSAGCNGAFHLRPIIGKRNIVAIASDGGGWRHVSIRIVEGNKNRTPTWEEMDHAKRIFWSDDELVLQYHPPQQNYVNDHINVLHLWQPIGVEVPTPPVWMV